MGCVMEVRASQSAVEFVRERGGRLYVWSKLHRCCRGGVTLLETSTDVDERREFTRVAVDGIDLYVDLPALPRRLEIDVRGRVRRSVRAYWDDCAWVT